MDRDAQHELEEDAAIINWSEEVRYSFNFHCIFYRALTIYQCFNSPSLFLFPALENSRGLENPQYFLMTFQSNHISQIHCFLILEDGIQVIHYPKYVSHIKFGES